MLSLSLRRDFSSNLFSNASKGQIIFTGNGQHEVDSRVTRRVQAGQVQVIRIFSDRQGSIPEDWHESISSFAMIMISAVDISFMKKLNSSPSLELLRR